MSNKLKASAKVVLILSFSTLSLLLLLLIASGRQVALVLAQAPTEGNNGAAIDPADLETLGFSAAEIAAAQVPASDFEIVKTASASSVTAGNAIDYTIRITNTHPTDDAIVFFYDDYPTQLQNVTYDFGGYEASLTTIFNKPKPTYVLDELLPADDSIEITVSGILTSNVDVAVVNTAQALDALGGSKSDSVAVNVIGVGTPIITNTIYLPFVAKPEPIVLAYAENFNSGAPWFEFDSGGCKTDHQSGQYWVDVDSSNRECLPPAKNENKPESAYRTYGEFQVDAYVSGENQDEDFWYGLFINGSGGDDYYVFRIQPNEDACGSGGDWELRRRKDDNETIIANGSCHPSIRRGYGSGATNTLKITHTSDRKLSVFANGTLLGSVTEPNSSAHLIGTGPGLFVRSASKDALVKYDNYIVNKIN